MVPVYWIDCYIKDLDIDNGKKPMHRKSKEITPTSTDPMLESEEEQEAQHVMSLALKSAQEEATVTYSPLRNLQSTFRSQGSQGEQRG
eukprot:14255322-Ditylum_brightwellii.AAC.1